jgi:ankyrin repeat protein
MDFHTLCFTLLQSGYTALHRAASQGHIEVITALVERGCDVNTQDEVYIFLSHSFETAKF